MSYGKGLRDLCLFSLKTREWKGNLTTAFSCLVGGYREDNPDVSWKCKEQQVTDKSCKKGSSD